MSGTTQCDSNQPNVTITPLLDSINSYQIETYSIKIKNNDQTNCGQTLYGLNFNLDNKLNGIFYPNNLSISPGLSATSILQISGSKGIYSFNITTIDEDGLSPTHENVNVPIKLYIDNSISYEDYVKNLTGLISFYRFENDLLDSSGNNNTGNCVGLKGCPSYVNGKFGRAVNFDGTDKKIVINNFENSFISKGSTSYTPMTIIMLAKRSKPKDAYGYILDTSYSTTNSKDGFSLSYMYNGNTYNYRNVTNTSIWFYSYNKYYYFFDAKIITNNFDTNYSLYSLVLLNSTTPVMVNSTGYADFYKYKVYKGNITNSNIYSFVNNKTLFSSNVNGLWVGAQRSGAYPYNGTIDELIIVNRALSESEINAIYQYTLKSN